MFGALLAFLVLWFRGDALPRREHWGALVRVALGVVIGFPVLSAFALRTAPASHAQVFVGLSPLATAIAATVLGGERPPRAFWGAALGGAAAILGFGLLHAGAGLGRADLLLLLAVAAVGFGYAEGGRLARKIGGLSVVSWALVAALPLTLPVTLLSLSDGALGAASPRAWLGFAYVSVVSMFLAFLAWYHGLSLGSVARTSQVQLLMPVLGVCWAALLLGEKVDAWTLLAGVLVGGFVFLSNRQSQAARRAPESPALSAALWVKRSFRSGR